MAEKDCTEVGLAEKSNPTAGEEIREQQITVDISHILGNLITVIFDYQILRKPLKILSL